MNRIASLIFHAPLGDTSAETLVERGRWAATLDLTRRLRAAGLSENYVLTPTPGRFPGGAGTIALLPTAAEAFDFGRVLQQWIAQLNLDGVLYFGSGAGGLLSEGELARLIEFARGGAARGLFNNFYSCDFCAVSSAQELLGIRLPAIDNPLGFSLADAGIPCFALARNAGTQFDIDTPTDLFLLERSGLGGPELRGYCAAIEREHPTLDRALAVLTDRSAVTCLIGRLSPVTWSHFETEVACRTSALVEGRGMRAGASLHVPWLYQVLAEDGPEAFFDRLERSCDAAWIDTRPILPATEAGPAAGERFSSDLFDVVGIVDPAWRAFTIAALRARIPVVLGGHSAISGGLYLAAEACWKGRNVARRLHPESFV